MSSSSNSKPTKGSANNTSWNASPFGFNPNTNTMDAESMPSEQAQAARNKTAEIMAALKKGDQGEADRLMGKNEKPATTGFVPIERMWKSFTGKNKKAAEDKVVQ